MAFSSVGSHAALTLNVGGLVLVDKGGALCAKLCIQQCVMRYVCVISTERLFVASQQQSVLCAQ